MPFIETGRAALRYDLQGAGPGTVVLIHEMAGMLESWDAVAPALAQHFRVLRFDMRGAGLSEKLVQPVTFADMAADLAGLMDALGVEGKVVLAGCAVGAGIALKFALDHPERSAGVIAMAPATAIASERRPAALALADRIEREGPRAVLAASFEPSYPQAVRHDTDVYRAARARWLGNDPRSFATTYRMLARSSLPDELHRLAVPSLFLAGKHDGNRTPEATAALASEIPGARFEALNSGHFMAIQTPEPVRLSIERFAAACFVGNEASPEAER